MSKHFFTDRVIIVGAGLGAIYAALKLAPHPVLMISPEPLGAGASSAWAQGGVAAAMDSNDSAKTHAADTITAGAGTVDKKVAEFVTQEARDHIHNLTRLGTPFDKTSSGNYVLSREAAHSFARVVRVKGDQAGRQIMQALIEAVSKTPSIQVMEGVMASGLETNTETKNDAVSGVWVEKSDKKGSEAVLISGAAYVLAGGGSGGLFAITTNPPRIRGQVIGLAARAGAVIADAEFVQFHPTAIDTGEDPAPLATEALRGEGATLINKDSERFMNDIHRDGELAPRDIVARAIFAQTQAGLKPMLDTRQAIGADILTNYPAVAEACERAGIDPVNEAIPVAAAAHYHMGGLESDLNGRTSLEKLWVCGEASSTGLHGANRLASNGLLEALVFAQTCATDIIETLGIAGSPAVDAKRLVIDFLKQGNSPDTNAVKALRQTMTKNVGVIRNATGLKQALVDIAGLEERAGGSTTFLNMTATATLITSAALIREESRGGHYRDDFPDSRPHLAKRSRMTLKTALDLRAKEAWKAQEIEEAP